MDHEPAWASAASGVNQGDGDLALGLAEDAAGAGHRFLAGLRVHCPSSHCFAAPIQKLQE